MRTALFVLILVGASGCIPRYRAQQWSDLAYLSGRLDADKQCVDLFSAKMTDDDRSYIAEGREDVDNMDVLAEESARETNRLAPFHGR